MKKLTIWYIMVAVLALVPALAYAASFSTPALTVRANIPTTSLTLSWGMSKVDSQYTDATADDTFTDVTANPVMDYGDLKHRLQGDTGTEAGLWFSRYYYAIFMGVISTSGNLYTISSYSAGLNGPGGRLPKGWGIAKADCFNTTTNQFIACPEGTALGSGGLPAEGTVTLYTSANPPTRVVTVRADYAIPPFKTGGVAPFSGHVPIPLTQEGGLYSGSVTVTVTD